MQHASQTYATTVAGTAAFMREARADTVKERIAVALDVAADTVHDIDCGDIRLSRQAVATLREETMTILRETLGADGLHDEQTLAMLGTIDRMAWWQEESRALVICLHLLDENHFVQIPGKHWELRPMTLN